MKISRQIICSFIFFVFLMMITGISAAENTNMSFVGHTGGWISNVAVAENYAYVGEGQDFVVLDIKDVNKPREVGKVATPGLVGDIAISGNYAYITENISLVIVDISNPSLPKIVGSYSLTNSLASGVTVSGNYAYVSCLRGFVALDISNPSMPTLAGRYTYNTYPASYTSDIIISGNYAYVPFRNYGLHIVDISNPSSPTRIAMFDTINVVQVAISSNYAYATSGDNGLAIIDISNLSSPTLVGSYNPTDARPTGIAVSDNYAYIANANSGDNGFTVLDITNVSSPKLVGKYATGSSDYVTLSGNQAYVINDQTGLAIVDVANKSSPKLLSNYNSIGGVRDVSVLGNYAYVADESSGLSVIDITDPSLPRFADRYYNSGTTYAVAVSGNYAYLASGDNKLVIVDISNSSSLKFASSCYTGYSFYSTDIDIVGTYAYIAYNGGIAIVDVANPLLPKLISKYDVSDIVTGIAVEGDYAYIADRDTGLIIVDITNTSSPKLVGKYSTGAITSDIAVAGNYAYIANMVNGWNGILVVDVTNRSSPTLAGKISVPAEGISISDNCAYVSCFDGLYAVDITNPSSPIVVGHYGTAGAAYNSCTQGDYVYVADERNGLVILKTNLSEQSPIKVGQGATTPEITQKFIEAYERNGGLSVLGNPTTKVHSAFGFEVQDFPEMPETDGGVIMYNSNNSTAYFIHGAIWDKYYAYAAKAFLGQIASDEKVAAIQYGKTSGKYTKFEKGTIHWISDNDDENIGHSQRGQSFVTYGALDDVYTKMGGTYSDLGFPIMDQNITQEGYSYCEFEGGYIDWDDSTSAYVVKLNNVDSTQEPAPVNNTELIKKVNTQLMLFANDDPMKDYDTTTAYFWLDIAGNAYRDEYDVYIKNVQLYRGLQYTMLRDALAQAHAGNEAKVNRDLNMANTYGQNARISFQNACDRFESVANNEYFVAQEVQTASAEAAKIVLISMGHPGATEAVDMVIVSYNDLAIENKSLAETGVDVALEHEEGKVLDVVFNQATNLPGFEGTTIAKTFGDSQYWRGKTSKDAYGMLCNALDSPEAGNAVFFAIKDQYPELAYTAITQAWGIITDKVDKKLNLAMAYQTAKLNSPGELRVYDSQGRVTGLVNGEIVEKIPYSVYDAENESVIILNSNDTYTYNVVGADTGEYGLDLLAVNSTQYNPVHLRTTIVPNEVHQYTVDWNNIDVDKSITLNVDSDGNGVFDENIKMPLPTASFTNIQIASKHISFNGSSSTGDNIASYNWDFGDGTSGDGQTVDHTYANEGYYNVTLKVKDNNGAIDSITMLVKVENIASILPVANFSSDFIDGFTPLTAQFTDLSENATSWLWDFGDGTNSTDQSPVHTYSVAGNYVVTLTVSNDNGTDSIFARINISEHHIIPPQSISNLQSSMGHTWINWTWTNPSDPYFNHTEIYLNNIFQTNASSEFFNATDLEPETSYTLSTRTVDNSGNVNQTWVNSTGTTKKVSMLPVANFSSNVSEGYAPLSVQFTDLSENATEWNWDFDDGDTSTDPSPTHTYYTAGNYTVNLTVSNMYSINSKLATITVSDKPVSVLPVANFSAKPTSGKAPLKVTFTDTSTGSPTSWFWNFGDGSKSYRQNPTHKYSKAGTYTVNLTVKNAKGRNTVTKTEYIKVITKPVANFSANPTSGKIPLKVTFTDTSTGIPAKWIWDFGDGSKSYHQNPTHKYSKAGIYTVNLTVKNAAGRNTVTKTEYIKVVTKPVANFSANPISGKTPLNVKFTDTSTGIPAKWIWDFGDGSKAFHQNPIHKYSKAGIYTVNLTVKNAKGRNTVTKIDYIKVITKPVANFTSSVTSGKTPLNVKFTDTSTGIPAKWIWDFGDGSKTFHQNPTHKYSKAGTYTVNLTVKNAKGRNTVTKTEYIKVTV